MPKSRVSISFSDGKNYCEEYIPATTHTPKLDSTSNLDPLKMIVFIGTYNPRDRTHKIRVRVDKKELLPW